jgi:hypothetical protein
LHLLAEVIDVKAEQNCQVIKWTTHIEDAIAGLGHR